ncbi:hypothetical protein ACR4XJ_12430 [Nitratidesulfovibrio sp. D1]|uniref:hypothetical protein n=1 Tax=Nitratidesulfovibrio sp. D1 TaxID=3440151 RepID=UPI003EB7F753
MLAFDDKAARLAGLNVTLKASVQRALASCGLSRAQVVDRMNALASEAGVRLTTGNARQLSFATPGKWLNPADREHPPPAWPLVRR